MEETATLAGGCFWCTEAVFKRLKGVEKVVAGYAEGAEGVQIKFNPDEITYKQILEVFFDLHDPTTLNQQGNDIGEQYRSEIFYHDSEQKEQAVAAIRRIGASGYYPTPVVTKVTKYNNFFPAENYHQNYYDQNRQAGYCRIIIDPKIRKLYRDFKDLIMASE